MIVALEICRAGNLTGRQTGRAWSRSVGLWHRALPLCTPHVLCATRNVRAKSQETGALPLLLVGIVRAGQATDHYINFVLII